MDVVEKGQLSPADAFEHWYYKAKFHLLVERLRSTRFREPGRRIADVGCGIGLFMTFLEKAGYVAPQQMVGIDPAYREPGRALDGGAAILPAWPPNEEVHVALLMDVLEHTPDDAAVLRETADHVETGGYVFITVPAFSWLYSAHDHFLGHYRRYSLSTLRRLIEGCSGLEIQELHYYYAAVFPAAVPWRLLRRRKNHECSDMQRVPGWLNRVLSFVMRFETVISRGNRLAGLSVVALCRKAQPAPRASAASDELMTPATGSSAAFQPVRETPAALA